MSIPRSLPSDSEVEALDNATSLMQSLRHRLSQHCGAPSAFHNTGDRQKSERESRETERGISYPAAWHRAASTRMCMYDVYRDDFYRL